MNQEQEVDEAQVSRSLHYVHQNGKCRPGTVVENYENQPHEPGQVNLRVHLDVSDVRTDNELDVFHVAVLPDHKAKTPGTWHWPRECSHIKGE